MPNPFDRVERGAESTVTPTASLEQKIIGLFRELLQIEHIGSQSHFFQLGGDSLLTALLMHHVYQGFGVEINFDEFANSPTPARMAHLIQAAAANGRKGIGSP